MQERIINTNEGTAKFSVAKNAHLVYAAEKLILHVGQSSFIFSTLLLPGVDRLDKKLTIGHMQGELKPSFLSCHITA